MDIRKVQISKEKVKSLPVPGIGFEITIQNFTESEGVTQIVSAEAELIMQGKGTVANVNASTRTENFSRHEQATLDVCIQLPDYLINRIEALRADDIRLMLVLKLLIFHEGKFRRTQQSYDLKYSQIEWSQILKELGYHDSWIFEVRRTELEGMDKVAEHLQTALDQISAHHYGDCVTNLRHAWDSIKPMLDAKWEKIALKIDEGSEGQEGHPPKSERIKSLYRQIRDFTHIGAHGEAYRVDPEDALLAYYQSVSMLSYLSKIMARIEL